MIKKITKLLSLAVVMAITTLASLTYAQEETSTTLVDAPTFRSKLTNLAGDLGNIERFVFTGTLGNKINTGIQASGEIVVYARYEDSDKTIYYHTVADVIYLNPASSRMFRDFNNLEEVDMTRITISGDTDTSEMFSRCTSLTSLDLSTFNKSGITTMEKMFNGCTSLVNLNLNGLNTEKVTNMKSMFNGCSSLTNLDLRSFDTSKVEDMNSMFYGCSGLNNLDLRSFDTSKVGDMNAMFNGCNSLTKLDLSNFNTSLVTRTSNMFNGCRNLGTILVSNLFNMSSVTNSGMMFQNAISLIGGKGTTYSGSHTDGEYARIDEGPTSERPGYFTEKLDKTVLVPGTDFNIELKQLVTGGTISSIQNPDAKIKHFKEGNLSQKPNTGFVDIAVKGSMYSVDAWYDEDEETIYYYTEADEIYLNTDSSWMFYKRNAVEDIDTSKFNTSEVENMRSMFDQTYNLQELDLKGFNTDKVTSMQLMFNENKALKELDLSSFVTSGVKTMEGMFNTCEGNNCSNLETVYVSSGFSTESLTTPTEGVFKGNNKLVGGNGTKFSGEYYDSTYARIDKEGQSGYFTDINNITVEYINIDDDGNETGQYITGVSKGDKVTGLTQSDIERKAGYSLKYYVDSGMETEFDFNQLITKYIQIYTKWEKQKSSGGNGGQSGGGGSHNNTPSGNDNKNSNHNQNQDNVTDTSGEKSQSTAGNNQSNKSTCAEGDLMCIHSWAYDNQLTKYNNIKNVKFDSLLKRQEMAKISSIFATKFYGKHPDESKKVFCSQYADLNKVNSDMKYYIIQSCELGLMGYKANGIDALENFRPYSPVSLAELSIIISRIMWGNTYALGEKQWYQGHLRATYEADIVDNINNPSRNITRGEAFEMFYRTSQAK